MSAALSAWAEAPTDTNPASRVAPQRSAIGVLTIVLLVAPRLELRAEVVLHRELDSAVVARVAIEVVALTPQELGADQDVLRGRVQNVRREVLALLERVAGLAVQVVDLVVAVADRAAPLRVPVVVE